MEFTRILNLDKDLHEWFLRMRSNKIEISGQSLQQQAKIIADRHKIANFTARQGYIDQFTKRYGVSFKKLYCQVGTVDNQIIRY